LLGVVAWVFSPSLQRICEANLQVVYGDAMTPARRSRIGRASFQSFALTMLDVFWFMRDTHHRVQRFVRVDDSFLPLFDRPPLIACTGHLGNWEIMSTLCGVRGAPVTAVAMPLKNPFADRLLNRMRRTTGSCAVPRQGAVRALLTSLKAGRSIALVMDQNTRTSEGGIFLPFLGLPATVSNAPGMLWQRTRVPLLVVDCTADRQGVYTARGSAVFPPAGEELSPEAVTARVVQELERVIRERPAHWLWSYKRWRYYREDDPVAQYPFYAKPYKRGNKR
jgi:KDO2-lipid IV(A) lauroyltransferase